MAARTSSKKKPDATAAQQAPADLHVEPQLAVVPGAIAEFSKTEAGLAEIRSRLQGRVFDVTTTEGMKEAREARRELVSLRTSLEAKRKEVKEDALQLCKRIDAEAARVRSGIVELEEPIDSQIRAREEAIEKAREEKMAAERREAARVQKVLDDLRNTPVLMTGKSADVLRAAIEDLEGRMFGDLPAPAAAEAVLIRDAAVQRMIAMKDERIRLDAERAELDAQRERQKEAERRAGYEREIAAIKSLPSDVYDSPVADIEGVLKSLWQRRFDTWPIDLAGQATDAAQIARDRLHSRLNEKQAAAQIERDGLAIMEVSREAALVGGDATVADVARRIRRLEAMVPDDIAPSMRERFAIVHRETLDAVRSRHSALMAAEHKADQEARQRAEAAEREARQAIERTSLLDAARLALVTLKRIRPATLVDIDADPTVIAKLESAIDKAEKGAALARDATEAATARMRGPVRKTAKTANRSRKPK